MPCLTCKPAKKLISPGGTLVLGTISDTDTDVYIWAENTATGVKNRQEATSSGAGLVTMDLTDPKTSFYHDNATYEIWVTDQTEDVSDALTLTIGSQTTECISVRFERSLSPTGTFQTDTAQTIELQPAA